MRNRIKLPWLPILSIAAIGISSSGVSAGEKVTLTPLIDIKGIEHTPLQAKGVKAVVLLFVVTDCPIANYFTSEIDAIARDYASKNVRCFVVHVDPDLTPDAAGNHAKEYGLTCPIVIDARHELVRATGATITPEAVVLTPGGDIAYRGRIDDRYVELARRRIEPNRRDLREALADVLAGRPVKEARTKAIGCPIPPLFAPEEPTDGLKPRGTTQDPTEAPKRQVEEIAAGPGQTYSDFMSPITRRCLLIAMPLVVLLLIGVAVTFLAVGHDLKSRSAQIPVGMPRAEVEGLLGPPMLELKRSSERGAAMIWIDQFWQVSVYTDPNGRTDSVECLPSDSLYRRTLGRLVPFPK